MKVIRDVRANSVQSNEQFLTPLVSVTPSYNHLQGVGGGLIYNVTSHKLLYNNGSTWLPVAAAGESNSTGFALLKNGVQTIPISISTIVAPWVINPTPPYSTIPGWDLDAGIFTALTPIKLFITASIRWAINQSNIGNRIVRIYFFDNSAATLTLAKEIITQPSADISIATDQETSVVLEMDVDDSCWVEVEHDGNIPLDIAVSSGTVISGIRMP